MIFDGLSLYSPLCQAISTKTHVLAAWLGACGDYKPMEGSLLPPLFSVCFAKFVSFFPKQELLEVL